MAAKTRREREREARRESILDAAEAVAFELGYASLTMDAVASSAEIAKGTVYLYFSSKDALLAAIAHRRISSMIPEFEVVMARESTGRAKVTSAARFFAQHFIAQPQHFRLMSSWVASTDPLDTSSVEFAEYRMALASMIGKIVEAIEIGKRDGSISLTDASPAIALSIWHGMFGILMARLAAPSLPQRMSFQPDFDAVLEVYLKGIDRMLDAPPRKEPAS
jgi:AcrR family transcriptional regulator